MLPMESYRNIQYVSELQIDNLTENLRIKIKSIPKSHTLESDKEIIQYLKTIFAKILELMSYCSNYYHIEMKGEVIKLDIIKGLVLNN